MSGNQDILLSQLDTEHPDLSQLEKAPSSLSVVNDEIILTYTDATTETVGTVNMPVDKTIIGGSIDLEGHLIIQYGDGTAEDLGKIKGVREIPYTTSGSGVLASQNEFNLTFQPLPIDDSLAVNKGVLTPLVDKLRLEHFSRFMAITNSQFGGRYRYTDTFVTPLNYAQINNLNLPMYRSVITLPPGKYYFRGTKTSFRNFHSMPRIVKILDEEDITSYEDILIGQMSVGFGSSTAGSTGYVAGQYTFTEETKVAMLTYAGDNRMSYSGWHAGFGFNPAANTGYNCYATLDIWELVNG